VNGYSVCYLSGHIWTMCDQVVVGRSPVSFQANDNNDVDNCVKSNLHEKLLYGLRGCNAPDSFVDSGAIIYCLLDYLTSFLIYLLTFYLTVLIYFLRIGPFHFFPGQR